MIMGDWTSSTYIASQVFTCIAYMLYAASYFVTERQKILALIIIGNVNLGIGFLLLGGYVGVGMCIVAITRDTVSAIIHRCRKAQEKDKTLLTDWLWLALWVSISTTIAAFTASSLISLTAYFGTLAMTISVWQKNGFIYRLLGILQAILWISYSLYLQSVMGTLLEFVSLVFIIIRFIPYIRNMKTQESN